MTFDADKPFGQDLLAPLYARISAMLSRHPQSVKTTQSVNTGDAILNGIVNPVKK